MIHIQWNTGNICIDPGKFFPCSLKTLHSLKKKVIDIAEPWSHREEVIEQIRTHLRERVKEEPSNPKLSRLLKEVEQWE